MKKYDNLKEIVKQLKWCNYECEAGTLENNVAFKALEEMVNKEDLKMFGVERQEFQVGDEIYCIDDDNKSFDDTVVKVELQEDKTLKYFAYNEWNFIKKDIGKYVFKSGKERDEYVEAL